MIRCCYLMLLTLPLFAQSPAPGDWPRYGRDSASMRFSPLKQITTGNVAKLKTAWTYQLRTEAERNRAGRAGELAAILRSRPSLSAE